MRRAARRFETPIKAVLIFIHYASFISPIPGDRGMLTGVVAAAAAAAAMTSRPPWCRTGTSAPLVEGLVLNEKAHAVERAESASLGYAAAALGSRVDPVRWAPAALRAWDVPPGALGYGQHDGPFRECGGRLLFATSRVVSAAVCARIIREARAQVTCTRPSHPKMRSGGGCVTPATVSQMQTSGSSTFTMTDTNRDVAVHDLPRTCRWLNAAFDRWLMPTVRAAFGDAASGAYVYRSLVVQYDAAARLTHQPVHRDGALITDYT